MNDAEFVTPIATAALYQILLAGERTGRSADNDLCISCGMCLGYCPVNSIRWSEESGITSTMTIG